MVDRIKFMHRQAFTSSLVEKAMTLPLARFVGYSAGWSVRHPSSCAVVVQAWSSGYRHEQK